MENKLINKQHDKRRKSVGKALTFQIIALIVVICSILGVLAYRQSSEALLNDIAESMEDRAVDASVLVSERISGWFNELELLSRRETIQTMDWDIQRPILSREAGELGYIRIGVCDLYGNLRYAEGKSEDISGTDFFRLAVEGKRSITSPYETDGEMIISIAVPIRNEPGAIVGVLVGKTDVNGLNSVVADIKVGNEGYAYMIDEKGTTIAHPDKSLVINRDNTRKSLEDDPALEPLAELENKMLNGEQGFGEYVYNGIAKLMSYAPIKDTGWSIALTRPKDEAFLMIYNLRNKTLIVTLVFIVVGILVGIFISRGIVNPLLKMEQFANELANGNLAYRLDLKRDDEFGHTVNVLNYAAESVKNIVKSILEMVNSSEVTTNILYESAEQVSAGSEEITSTILQVAEGANEQAECGRSSSHYC